LKCPRQPVAGLRDANFLAVVLIHRAGKVFFVSRFDFCQQIFIISRFVFCKQIPLADLPSCNNRGQRPPARLV
jgi:hypothetical protein